jgi:tRNA/rRNA methyltransferase
LRAGHGIVLLMTISRPKIILVHPQMGENIGAAARAMLNCGLCDLRLVKPRDGWPNERADAMSSGALEKMPPVEVFETTEDAVADCHYIYATTARIRDMEKPVFTGHEAGADMKVRAAQGQNVAILFGPERAGLHNDDVALSHAAITIPLNPDFSSLNLGQAVLLMAYEWLIAQEPESLEERSAPAPHAQQVELFERLESELEKHKFFR